MGTSGVVTIGIILGSGIVVSIAWKERSRARRKRRSNNDIELGTLNDVEPRVGRQQGVESEAFHQSVSLEVKFLFDAKNYEHSNFEVL